MITLKLDKSPPHYDPQEAITGEVSWADLPESCTAIELRLIWYTSGKGDLDVETVARSQIVSPGASGQQRFHFNSPLAPYSFSGKLISLSWGIEAVQLPSGDSPLIELVLAPQGREVRISASGAAES